MVFASPVRLQQRLLGAPPKTPPFPNETHQSAPPVAGTVQYIGNIEGDARERLWIGVAWDDPTYGKHDGRVFGKTYFTCAKLWTDDTPSDEGKTVDELDEISRGHWLSSGSFLAASALVQEQLGMTFTEALTKRYRTSAADDAPVIFGAPGQQGSRAVEIVGLAKAEQHFQDFSRLESIDLSNFPISSVGTLDGLCEGPMPHLGRVQFVSLSGTLLSEFTDVLSILAEMPNAKTLVISHCRFARDAIRAPPGTPLGEALSSVVPWRCPQQTQHIAITHLIAHATGMELPDFALISKVFPSLKTLDISLNPQLFDDLSVQWIQHQKQQQPFRPPLNDLTTVLSQSNRLSNWERALLPLALFPTVSSLILNSNALSDTGIERAIERLQVAGLPLSELALDNNKIRSWSTLVCLAKAFPSLEHFRWQDNPLQISADAMMLGETCEQQTTREKCSALSGKQLSRQLVTAIFEKLTTLNGGPITAVERKHAELYFLSLCARQLPVCGLIDPTHMHQTRLERIHQTGWFRDQTEGHSASVVTSSIAPALMSVRLVPACSAAYGRSEMTRDVAAWLKVGDLKALCSRLFSIPSSKQRLMLVFPKRSGRVELHDDSCPLSFYGLEPESTILVGDVSEV